jgi:hypothetical protein
MTFNGAGALRPLEEGVADSSLQARALSSFLCFVELAFLFLSRARLSAAADADKTNKLNRASQAAEKLNLDLFCNKGTTLVGRKCNK